MKNRYLILTFILCLAFAIFFVSCGKEKLTSQTNAQTTEESSAFITEAESFDSEIVPMETETDAPEIDENLREPVDNEKAVEFIEFQYKKATELIDWIENRSLSADLSVELYDAEGTLCFPTIDSEKRPELDGESINSFAALKKYINCIFARSIADDLIELAKENYMDLGDTLCLKAVFADTDPSIEPDESESSVISTEFFLSKFTEKFFRYTAKVTYSSEGEADSEENVKYFDFIFENTGSGWYWTAFPKIAT